MRCSRSFLPTLGLLCVLALGLSSCCEPQDVTEPELYSRLSGLHEPDELTGAMLQFELVWPVQDERTMPWKHETLVAHSAQALSETPSRLFASLRSADRGKPSGDADASYVHIAGSLGGTFWTSDDFEVSGVHQDGDALVFEVKFRRVISYDGTPGLALAYFAVSLPRAGAGPRTVEIRFKQVQLSPPDIEEDLVPPVLKDVLVEL